MDFVKKEIKVNTLGGLFKKARLSRKKDLPEVARAISIEEKYLRFIEEDDFYKLPDSTRARGFLKRYAEFLKLNSEEVVQEWATRYGYQDKLAPVSDKKIEKDMQKFFKRINFKIISIFLVLFFILFYLGLSFNNVLGQPKLEIIYPPQEFVTTDNSLLIQGQVDSRAEVFINQQLVDKQDEQMFSQEIKLLPGLNIIRVSAKKKYSKTKTVFLHIVLE
jgi:cytoskeletal protein RodZ